MPLSQIDRSLRTLRILPCSAPSDPILSYPVLPDILIESSVHGIGNCQHSFSSYSLSFLLFPIFDITFSSLSFLDVFFMKSFQMGRIEIKKFSHQYLIKKLNRSGITPVSILYAMTSKALLCSTISNQTHSVNDS